MRPLCCFDSLSLPLVIDASVAINLNATGCASDLIRAIPNDLIMANVVQEELNSGICKGRLDAERTSRLVEDGHIKIVQLGEEGVCVTAVAADGKRFSLCAQRDAVCQGVEWSATIPAKTVRAIQKEISDTRQVYLFIGKNHAEFFLDDLLITSPLLNMHYPYFETFIPSKYDVEAITQLLPLKHAVATARTLTSPDRDFVTLTFYVDRVRIEVDTPEVGRYEEAVELDADIENHPWAITFQTSCLLDTLSAMKSSSVRLRGTYEPAPAVFLPRFDDQHGQFDSEGWREVHVIMPRRPEMTPAAPQPSDGPQQSDDSDATAEMDGNAP